MTAIVADIAARDNPTLVAVRRTLRDGAAYRRTGAVWLEGEHLCGAAADAGLAIDQALVRASAWSRPGLRDLAARARRVARVADALFDELSTLESPAAIGFVLARPAMPAPDAALASVVLDRLQDAGNVGSMLRSAAALGITQVLALKGTVALWSPKVLRAGMGAHFGLRLVEGLAEEGLPTALALVATSSHAGDWLHECRLPPAPAWVFGHEGQGVAATLVERCPITVRIPQPGGGESLNVAAAAAICFYEQARRRVAA